MSTLRSMKTGNVAVPAPDDPGAHLNSLRASTGTLQRIGTKFATSAEAGRALRQVERKQVWSKHRVAEVALEIATVKVTTAIVSSAMPALGALAVQLNCQTTAVDQLLSISNAGEVASHIENRHKNLLVAEELRASGKLSDEEKSVVANFIEADTADDIARSRKRMTQAKDAVASLHSHALAGIEQTKSKLQH